MNAAANISAVLQCHVMFANALPSLSALCLCTGKHPVSALIELCNKRRIMQPDFVMVHHSGPDHRKNFLFKVSHLDFFVSPALFNTFSKLSFP